MPLSSVRVVQAALAALVDKDLCRGRNPVAVGRTDCSLWQVHYMAVVAWAEVHHKALRLAAVGQCTDKGVAHIELVYRTEDRWLCLLEAVSHRLYKSCAFSPRFNFVEWSIAQLYQE